MNIDLKEIIEKAVDKIKDDPTLLAKLTCQTISWKKWQIWSWRRSMWIKPVICWKVWVVCSAKNNKEREHSSKEGALFLFLEKLILSETSFFV